MTSTLQQVADDLASHIGEMRVVMDEMARALVGMNITLDAMWNDPCRLSYPMQERHTREIANSQYAARRALSAYERVRKLYSETTGDAS